MNQTFNNLVTSTKRTNELGFITTLLAFVLVITTPTLFAEEKEERWFEFEVILFKLKSEDGLYAESWKDDSQLKLSEDAVDFLQPFEVLEVILETENSEETNSSDEMPLKDKDSIVDTFYLHDGVNEYEQEEIGEQAFIRLADELLQLNSESKSIKRQSRYQLIEHFSWRQPVDSRANATKIRIAGGFDYSENFEYSGDKKIEFIPIVEDLFNAYGVLENDLEKSDDVIKTEEQALIFEGKPNQKAIVETQSELTNNELINDSSTQETLVIAEPKPLDWVPEIDGEIKVYIHRNYLHVDTNLVYRKPQEITVDIFHLDEQPLGYDFTTPKPLAISLLDEAVAENDVSQKNNVVHSLISELTDKNNTFSVPSTNFNWEFDSDFLNQKAEKLFTQKLFNYPLIQERRVRSGELHYFDHPLIGMLIIIRPYETEVFEDELIESEINNLTE
ncbi:MAG: hypothetical protein COB38_08720 [Gammaproteobacteria bacterium]|nr:MAG: hypothetical protein COB38_08720 [Gammaproteobacteria bacterium]